MDMTVDRLLDGEMPSAALCQANIVLGGGTPFHPLEVIMVGAQVWGDVPHLNKIHEMPSPPIPLGNRKLG